MDIKSAICITIACTLAQAAVAAEDTLRRCTDRSKVLYTDSDCPNGWIESIGDQQNNKRRDATIAKGWKERNQQIEANLRQLEKAAQTKQEAGTTSSQRNATK